MPTVIDLPELRDERPAAPAPMKPRFPATADLGATRYYVNVDSIQSGPRGDATQEQIQAIGDAIAEAVQAELLRIGVRGVRAYEFLRGCRFEAQVYQDDGE